MITRNFSDEEVRKFNNVLLSSADIPNFLRASDVYRVMTEANNLGCMEEFREWLLSRTLMPRTRQFVTDFDPTKEEWQ